MQLEMQVGLLYNFTPSVSWIAYVPIGSTQLAVGKKRPGRIALAQRARRDAQIEASGLP